MKIEDEELFKFPELQKHLLYYFLKLHLPETIKYEVTILPTNIYLYTIQKLITLIDNNNNKTDLCWERVGCQKVYSKEEIEFKYPMVDADLTSMLLETVKSIIKCNSKNKKYLKVIIPDKGVFVTFTPPVFSFQIYSESHSYIQSEVAFTISDANF